MDLGPAATDAEGDPQVDGEGGVFLGGDPEERGDGAGRVTLRETVVRAGKEWVVKPTTKTGGERFVDIDAGTLGLLRVLHDQAFASALACGVALPADAFVFSDEPDGSVPWKPATTARRFKRACAAAGLPATTRLHDLRHLMATHLIDQGVSIAAVSARLGHAQNSTTLDIYTGRVAGSDRGAADVMGRFLDGPSGVGEYPRN